MSQGERVAAIEAENCHLRHEVSAFHIYECCLLPVGAALPHL